MTDFEDDRTEAMIVFIWFVISAAIVYVVVAILSVLKSWSWRRQGLSHDQTKEDPEGNTDSHRIR